MNNFKMDELSIYAKQNDLDVIGITETWLTENIGNSEISIENYTLYRKDRSNIKGGRGGGVLLYISNSVLSLDCLKLNRCENESVWCEILLPRNKSLLLGVVYNSPNASVEEVANMLAMLRSVGDRQLVILGDFNYPGINWDTLDSDSLGRPFLDLVQDCFWHQLVTSPTRGDNILDLILTSDEEMVDNVLVIESLSNSDHNMIKFELFLEISTKEDKQIRYDLNKGNYSQLNTIMDEVNWGLELDGLDAEKMWDKFQKKMSDSIVSCIPTKKPRNYQYPRWMTRCAIRARNYKLRMWKRFRLSGTYNDKVEYKRALNNATAKYKAAKQDFEKKLAKDIKSNPKSFYAYVRSKSATKSKVSPLKDSQGNIVIEDIEICNVLNQYFSSVFTKENSNCSDEDFPVLQDLFTGNPNDVLQNVDITVEAVWNKLKKLSANKAPGVDGMMSRVLLETADAIAKPLSMIFKASLTGNVVPKDWRRANVVAVYKKGPRDCPGNYRPISLTSQVCKVMESILKDEIVKHLEKFKLINSSQHGFMKGKSCLTNLLEFLHSISSQVDNGEAVDVIYLDFQKAFDKVPHRRLVKKITAYGIGGTLTNWIKSWLTGREQRVVVNQNQSEWCDVLSGVPQGSVLGPLLFIIYINDLDYSVANRLFKFADDTKISSVVSTDDQVEKLRLDLVNLSIWSHDWLMSFNVEKCKVMHLGKQNRRAVYSIDGTVLNDVKEECDLGVIVQDDLKVSKQCLKAVTTANKILGMISRTFVYKSSAVILQLYKSLVRPHLEYCVQAWRPHLQKDISLLEGVQRRATRMADSLKGLSYEQRLDKMGITTLETRRLRGDLLEVFKICKGFEEVDSNDFFNFHSGVTRGHDLKLYKNRFKTDCGKYMFANRVVNEWNLLNIDVVASDTVLSFKTKLDRYLKYCRGFT
jgi:hypothetical protein